MTFQVAIVGSPGSGKTVLTAVLSKYLAGHSDRIYMNPREAYEYIGENPEESISTMSYISRTLQLLHDGEWAGRTEGANRCELGFDLHIHGNVYEMKLLDSAGEDLQRIFQTFNRTKLSQFQQRLFEYITSSSAVAIIVNLNDFTDAETLTKRNENEAVITEVITNLVEAGKCHYILICFTAYDKYKAHIDQTYRGSFINYLNRELPMFSRSCKEAREAVCDYTKSEDKMIRVDCIAVAPVIAQKLGPPDRLGKPPIGFDVSNPKHSMGMETIANWLYECEQSERVWDKKTKDDIDGENRFKILIYWVFSSVIGALVGVIACLVLPVIMGYTLTDALLFNGLFIGLPIGAGIGFLIGDKLKVLIAKEDGLIFKEARGDEDEEQDESVTSRPTATGGTSTASPRPSGTSGTSTSSPRPSGTGGTAATSGSEKLD